ncbi:Predicted CoA-binding protein [Evansella caseinilytica]|uniref:Predicted CoA-binding protein n=1 Tax=Evansella caseinilytica TaxID=1503961 RepID=A0A1H3U7V4_9BACI|nr:CoA-binding protein [Evansella caseinilytica]SDZ58367.1 Predicted CoA-binding protein [Evansella caseinilytica]
MENPSREEIKQILDRAKVIAIVGLSNNPERTSYQIAAALQHAGYEIIPVNPTIDEVFGIPALASLKELTRPVDIINVFRKNEFLPEVARDAAAVKADVFWCQLGLENEEAYEIAKNAGMTVIMDRCIKVEHALTR